jgi:hypothetical protein
MKKTFRRRSTRLAFLGAIGLAGAAGVAYATHAIATGDQNEPLVACVADPRGTMRAVDDASECGNNEIAVKLQRFLEPQSVTVDCAAGETVGDALLATASAPRVTISVEGTCTETVFIGRDNVRLVAAAAGDGFTGPAANQAVLILNGRRISVTGLTLTGGSFGLAIGNGAQVSGDALQVTGAQNAGILVAGNAVATIVNSTVENSGGGLSAANGGALTFFGGTVRDVNGEGARAAGGGTLFLRNSVVEDSDGHGIIAYPGGSIEANGSTVRNSGNTGAYAFGGAIQFSGGLIEGTTFGGVSADEGGLVYLGGTTVARNGLGVGASGGSILMQGATVEDNLGDGVRITNSSSVSMRFGVTIRDNTGNGISISDNSVANFGHPPATVQILDNDQWGIHCDGAPSTAVIRGAVGTVSGNTSGQNNCQSASEFG